MHELESRTAQWLLENPLEQPGWIIEDFIPCGLTLLAGDPKIGKSWLVLDLALHVAQGEPFWGFAATKGTVLFLSLEDTFSRIQERLQKITDEAGYDLYCVTSAEHIGTGLVEQIEAFAAEHKDLAMVIIDTFQTVRTPSSQSIYAADYDDMGVLKKLADRYRIALIAVHHTRKLGDGDVFNTISGSNGLMGCADETIVLKKKNRGCSSATLTLTGRDVKDQEFKLQFRNCRWELVEKTTEEEFEARAIPQSIHAVLSFMLDGIAEIWEGTASDLTSLIDCPDIKANILAKYLNEHSQFLRQNGVYFNRKTVRGTRLIHLEKSHEGAQGVDGVG